MTLNCPICSSEDVAVSTSQRSIAAPLGPSVRFEIETDTCANCGESGDFAKHNDPVIRRAEEESTRASIEQMLESLSQRGCTMAYMERSLSLPARTVARWKNGEASAAAVALLRMVATYPWLLEVADARFAPRFASAKVVVEAGKTLGSAVQSLLIAPTASTYNVSYNASVRLDTRTTVLTEAMQTSQLIPTG